MHISNLMITASPSDVHGQTKTLLSINESMNE